MADADAEHGDRRAQPRRKLPGTARAFFSVALVLVLFVGVLPRIADLSEVRAHIEAMTGLEVGSLVVLGLWNLVSYAGVYLASLPGLRPAQAMVVTQASTAIANTVPAGAGFGIGVTWGMLTSWGFRRAQIALLVLITGMWNLFAKLVLPIVALALLAVQGRTTSGSFAAAGAGIAAIGVAVCLFTVMLGSDAGACRVGAGAQRAVSFLRRLIGRPPVKGWDAAAASFRASTNELLRTRWLPLTVTTLVSHLSLFAVLLVSLRHVGVREDEVTTLAALAGFAFVRLISALPLTPGGLGIVELGLTAALVTAGGDREAVVAAVLVYRATTYLPPVPLGALSLFFWRRWRRRPAQVPGGVSSSAS